MSLLHDLLVLIGLARDEPPTPLQIVLFDPLGRRMPSAPFVVTVNGEDRKGVADAAGLASAGSAPEAGTVAVQWRRRPEDYPPDLDAPGPDDYEYSAEVTIVPDTDPVKAAEQRLRNLGYFGGVELAESVTAFQEDHGLAVNGDADDPDFQAAFIREYAGLQVTRPSRVEVPAGLPEEE